MNTQVKHPARGLLIFALATALFAAGIHTAMALSGYYRYANDGSYFTAYGPSSYWHITNNVGWCGSSNDSSCSPYNMRWTYTNGTYTANYAKWDNIDSAQYATLSVYIPNVNATTTNAPYLATYNGASSYSFYINQNIYYNQWITGPYLYDIRNVYLDDNTGESPGSTKVGFDEVRLLY
ncbi:MAG: hypothetical protein IVW55_09760 [Chloroflexi bacterium]|nr:hypothetical protein [Chloroflexota bacterium]